MVRRYAVYLALIGVAGDVISAAAGAIIRQTGLSPVDTGLTLTALATSLPELVTAVASVGREAVSLAIGDIVGGNAFDTIMVALPTSPSSPGPSMRPSPRPSCSSQPSRS